MELLAALSGKDDHAVFRIDRGRIDNFFDFFTLDESAPALAGASADDLHDRFVFAGNVPLVRDVYVGGRRVVEAGRHPGREEIAARYRRALRALLADG